MPPHTNRSAKQSSDEAPAPTRKQSSKKDMASKTGAVPGESVVRVTRRKVSKKAIRKRTKGKHAGTPSPTTGKETVEKQKAASPRIKAKKAAEAPPAPKQDSLRARPGRRPRPHGRKR